ncbi:DsbE family thiol:disulfide interchange protein [Alphaproteobacteria bacterium GH1-50]|uniref:DsbE family thiol:disulfide interchange protein n=1 Tax=Kangsaoukella pontilimi TaxID=2691042 RepID=A0A7C9MQ33_9RHOB|nr:DsbE family thiol:disulfide interchange protein [Kangsaoukella pontilimi]MXQ07017.1 DsbE family thiol:disulfide interchange protein [Kangsaoukella pontilimi]
MARISPLVLLPPVAFAALAGLFLSGMFRDDPDALPSTLVGRAAPALEVTALSGEPLIDREALNAPGPKIVNFWASWCAPCRVEHPHLMALADEGIPIYGVNYKDDADKALGFLAELGDPYTAIGADERGRVALEWGVYGVPETFVIDSDGKVVLRFAGPVTAPVLANRIRPALAEAQ